MTLLEQQLRTTELSYRMSQVYLYSAAVFWCYRERSGTSVVRYPKLERR